MVKVRKHKRGWWQVHLSVRLPDQSFYEKKRKSPCASKTAALRWGEEWQASVLANWREVLREETEAEVPTVEEFVPRFIEDHARANKLKPSTIHGYEDRLKKHVVPVLGQRKLNEITMADVQKLKASWSHLSGKTVNTVLGVISKMLNVAVEWAVIDAVPVKLKKVKAATMPYPFYDFDQYAKVVAAARQVGNEAVAVMLLGGDAGLRRGEIAALEWSDIDFGNRTVTVRRTIWNGNITVPKGGRARTLPMTEALHVALKAIRHLRGPRVFYKDDGEPVSENTINEMIPAVLRQAGMKVTRKVHILRHTFCSHLAMRGAPAKAIQELAGHTDLTTTMRYMHLAPGSLQAAVALLESRPQTTEAGNIAETANPNSPNRT